MIKAKLLAMCVCPAIAAPPAILAVHAPARHAVAHLLHRAAARLDHSIPAAKPAPGPLAVPALPCTPSLDGAGGGLPVTGGALLGGSDGLAVASAALGGGFSNGGGGFGGSNGSGFGGGSSGSGSSGGGGFGGGSSGSGSSGGGANGGTTGSVVSGTGGLPGISSGSSNAGSIGGTVGGSDLPLPPSGFSPVLPGRGYSPSLPSSVSGAPEPATWAFLVIGFGLVGAFSRRDRGISLALVAG